MLSKLLVGAFAAIAFNAMAQTATQTPTQTVTQTINYANSFDRSIAGRYDNREKDWRNGAIVYQVLVDRFAPSANLEAKKALYPAPKTLNPWTVQPKRGTYSAQHKLWTHEIDFWGGDLASTRSKLDYVQGLGVDVLYLNPIHLGYTNHKYDALDYEKVSPEFGTRDDVKALAADTKRRNMKLVLDGEFNHVGRLNPKFIEAEANPQSPYRQWFLFGPQYKAGFRAWWDVENLPELNLENQAVRDHIYAKPNSVVRSYLRDGVDGWRLDVAFDIGFNYLRELTIAAQTEKPGALVVGEIPNYPREWFPSVDGVMHFGLRNLMIKTVNRELDPVAFSRMVARMIGDANYDNILRSWVYLDNHDTFRLATTVPDAKARKLAQVLQFTLPGSPNLYYGSEVAMEGGDDPEQRGPMAWDRVEAKHPELAWNKLLIALRKANRALRVGDFRLAEASGPVVAFERYTDRVADSVLVLMNPSMNEVTTTVMVANSKWMDGVDLVDQLGGERAFYQSMVTTVKLPPQTVRVYKPKTTPLEGGYSNFKRVQ